MFGARWTAGGWTKWVTACGIAAAAVVGLGAGTARAHPHDVRVEVVVPGDSCPPPVTVARQVWVEPVYRTVCDRQWVEPTYRTVVDRVWVPAVTRAAAPVQVWVPDQYGYQDGVSYDRRGRPHAVQVPVLLAAGHYETTAGCQTIVTPGYYQDVTRQELACAGHWAAVERQELVCPGHYQTRYETVAPPPPHRPEIRIRLPF